MRTPDDGPVLRRELVELRERTLAERSARLKARTAFTRVAILAKNSTDLATAATRLEKIREIALAAGEDLDALGR